MAPRIRVDVSSHAIDLNELLALTSRKAEIMKQLALYPLLFCFVCICSPAAGVGTGNDLLPDVPVGPDAVRLEVVASISPNRIIDIESPQDGSGRLFLVSPQGVIRILDGGVILPTPFLTEPATPTDRGMPTMAFHPDFGTNGKLYVVVGEPTGPNPHYTAPQNDTSTAFDNVLYEYMVDAANPNVVDPASKRELLRVHQPQRFHNMNDLVFGDDGYLYIAMGDGGNTRTGSPTQYQVNAQDTSNPHGSVLRIDVDSIGSNGRYEIPGDNPFATGAVPEIYAWGLRNPWRMTKDSLTGEIYTGVNGDFTIEWVVRVGLGENYGWPTVEGSFLWDPISGNANVNPSPDPLITLPIAEYDHNWTTESYGSIIGGYVYRGSALPELVGKYMFHDWLSAEMMSMDTGTGSLELVTQVGGVVLAPGSQTAWGQDEAGELYVGSNNGQLLKLMPVTQDFRRGDCNDDGTLNLADVVCALDYLFQAAPSTCDDAHDMNDDGMLDISDPVTQLGNLFGGGPPLPQPFPGCGADPTADTLGCGVFASCP